MLARVLLRWDGRVVVAAVLLALITGVPCFSQSVEVGKKATVNLGVFRPTDGDVRDLFGASWFAAGIGVKVLETKTSEHQVELGYIQSKSRLVAGFDAGWIDPNYEGRDVLVSAKHRIVPIRYTILQKPQGQTGLYWGGGAGVYFSKTEWPVTLTDGEESESLAIGKSHTKLGVHLVLGEKFADRFNVELRYNHLFGDTTLASHEGARIADNLSSITLTVGASF